MITNLTPAKEEINGKKFEKQIDAGAHEHVMNITQSNLYSKPLESTIRESVSNAVDSTQEKINAIKILTGVCKIEDYYIEQEGGIFKDSKFDPSYYDLKFLNSDNNVDINYTENFTGTNMGFCDMLCITDRGVGISGKRLIGMTSIGYSTKRSSNVTLGAFGLGSKAPLATQVTCFNITSCHNGRKYSIDVYDFHIVNKISIINLQNGAPNKYESFIDSHGEEFRLYYEETTEKNGATIAVPVKKNNRHKVTDTISSTLRFFNTVKYYYKAEGQTNFTEKSFLAEILYQTKNLVVTKDSDYSSVNIALVRDPNEKNPILISYGALDFNELDITPLRTPVTLIMPYRSAMKDPITREEIILQEGISVTPSRESIIYDEYTVEFIKKHLSEKVQAEVQAVVDKMTDGTDFVDWIKACHQIRSSASFTSGNTYLNKLVPLINTSHIKLTFDKSNGNDLVPMIFTKSDTFLEKLSARNVTLKSQYGNPLGAREVTRSDKKLYLNNDTKFYYSLKSVSKVKDLYIMDKHLTSYEKMFVLFQLDSSLVKRCSLNTDEDLQKAYKEYVTDFNKTDNIQSNIKVVPFEVFVDNTDLSKMQFTVYNLVKNSKSCVDYDAIVVPEDYKDSMKVPDKEDVVEPEISTEEKIQQDLAKKLTPAEMRKLSEEILIYAYDSQGGTKTEGHKVTLKNSRLINCKNPIVYGFQEDDEALSKFAVVCGESFLNDYSRSKSTNNFTSIRITSGRWPVNGWVFSHKCLKEDIKTVDELGIEIDEDKVDKVDFPYIFRVSKDNGKYLSKNPNAIHISKLLDLKIDDSIELSHSSDITDPDLSGTIIKNITCMSQEVKRLLTSYFVKQLLDLGKKQMDRYVKYIPSFEPDYQEDVLKLIDYENRYYTYKSTSIANKVMIVLGKYNIFCIKNKESIDNGSITSDALQQVLWGYCDAESIDRQTFTFDSKFNVNVLDEEIISVYLRIEEYINEYNEIYSVLNLDDVIKNTEKTAIAVRILNAVKNGLV